MNNPFADALQKLQAQLHSNDKLLATRLEKVVRQQSLASQISAVEQQKQILSHLYQSAHSFTNLVIVAGYAGLFAVWQFVRDVFDKEAMILTAILLTLSIVFFAFYETYKMISEAFFFRRLDRIILSEIAEQNRMQVWQLAFIERAQQEARIWIYFLLPIVITGFGAAAILIVTFLQKLR